VSTELVDDDVITPGDGLKCTHCGAVYEVTRTVVFLGDTDVLLSSRSAVISKAVRLTDRSQWRRIAGWFRRDEAVS
jgi:hypothetical protein